MDRQKLVLHVVLPSAVTLGLMGLYFSGHSTLQQIIVPTVDWLPSQTWREFGLLEMLQNGCLLFLVILCGIAVFKRSRFMEKGVAVLLLGGFLLMFLEEIDYGLNFYELATGEASGREVRNWHNQKNAAGHQHVRSIKKAVDAGLVAVVAGLLFAAPYFRGRRYSGLIPSRWFIATILLALTCSKFGHLLSDLGYGVVNGVEGKLAHNISEFRELNIYYMALLYGLQLYRWHAAAAEAPEPVKLRGGSLKPTH